MKRILIAALVWIPMAAAAQPEAGCEIANAVFGAFLKGKSTPCAPSKADTAPTAMPQPGSVPTPLALMARGGSLNTPENLATLVTRVQVALKNMDLLRTTDKDLFMLCPNEMRSLDSQRDASGGFEALEARCRDAIGPDVRAFSQRRLEARNEQRNDVQRARDKEQEAAQKVEDAETQKLMVELRAGRRQPVNCAQWFAAKGQDSRELDAKITEVAFQPPQGIGAFAGRVEKLEGQTMLLSDQPVIKSHFKEQGYIVIGLDPKAKVFNGALIKLNSVVSGFAEQTGTRNIRLVSGASKQAPVLHVVCLNHVM